MNKNLLLSAVLAFIYLLLFSVYTSPLFPDYYLWDSPFFMLIGEMVSSGTQLYTGVFDDKGPVIFVVNALGYGIGGRNGVFFLQWVFLIVDILIMKKIFGLFTDNKSLCRKLIFLTLIFLAFSLAGGNTCEEYNLPFILISFYYLISDIKVKKPGILHSIWYGIGISVCALTRITNGVSIFAIVLFWIIYLSKNRRWRELLLNIIAGFSGILIVFLPVILYFAFNGSLDEMIYDVFIINISYASNSGYLNGIGNLSVLAHIFINFFPFICAILVFQVYLTDKLLKTALTMVTLCNIPVLLLGGGYNHYFAITLPIVLCINTVVFINHGRRSIASISAIFMTALFAVLAVRIIIVNVNDYYISSDYRKEFETVRNDFHTIPEWERDSILGYSMAPRYYIIGEVMPCYKYCAFQDIWVNEDPKIKKETEEYFAETPPCWLVIEEDYQNEWLERIIDEKYELRIEDNYCVFYRLLQNS